MANLTPPPPRSAANQTPCLIFGGSNVRRALRRIELLTCLPAGTKRWSCFADDSKAAPAFTAGQRYVFCGESNAGHAFRAETRADFRYTSIQGAVPKW